MRDDSSLIIVIGRGRSGTRTLSHTLSASGVFMGKWLNSPGDKIPGDLMYKAARLMAAHVDWDGDLSWDFSRLHSMSIDPEFAALVDEYLEDVLRARTPRAGWKLPETILAYPWIVRMFPRASYVRIVRDPRDCLLGRHQTDNLADWGIPCAETTEEIEARVASWKYQYDIVKATPEPERFISVRYEDIVLDQEATLCGLEDFLEIPLARIVVRPTQIRKWRSDAKVLPHLSPLAHSMRELGYGNPLAHASESGPKAC